jgi:hypothetical protein
VPIHEVPLEGSPQAKFALEISDHDLVGANDFLGGATLDMGRVVLETEKLFEGICRHNAEKAAREVAAENDEGSGSESDDEEKEMVVIKDCVLMGKDGGKDTERGRVQLSFTWEPNRLQREAVGMECNAKLQSEAARLSKSMSSRRRSRYTKRAEDGSDRELEESDRALRSSPTKPSALNSDKAAAHSEVAMALPQDTAAARSEFGLTAQLTPTEPIRRIVSQKREVTETTAPHPPDLKHGGSNWEQNLRAREGTIVLTDLIDCTADRSLEYGDVRVIV